jgi:hypothetical protein
MQLDIFDDSRDLMLRNDVLHALERRDAAAAQLAWQQLQAAYAQDETLPLLQRLIGALHHPDAGPFADAAEASTALHALRDGTVPAARRLWDATTADAWLAPLWAGLARRAAALPYDAAAPDLHAAALWLNAGDFGAAAHAVTGIASWRRIPVPLAWMTEARHRLDGLDASWALLAELAWLAPQRFDMLLPRLRDPLLTRLRRQFDAEFEGDGQEPDSAWFPAWLLCEKPALAPRLGQAQSGLQRAPEQAMRLLLDLLHLERQGRQHDLPAQRRRLRELQPALYAAYMKSR